MRLWIAVLLWFAAGSVSADATRTVFAISDLHFGVGKAGDTGWHPYEDFRWKTDLLTFLDAIDKDGNGKVDLILNGDTFELWQSTVANECAQQKGNANLGCSEKDALARLRRAMAAHADELDALKSFATKNDNRVYLVPGNHDGALMFAKLARELSERMKGSRFEVVSNGRWVSADGTVVAEHGHQIGRDVNAFSAWPKPFVTRDGVTYVQRSGGEEFVLDVYNQYELRYPIIDNITEESTGVKYAIATEGAAGLAQATGRFLGFLLVDSSWPQASSWLGKPGEQPEWNLKELRGEIQQRGAPRLGELLRSDDPLRKMLNPSTPVPDLSDEELGILCDRAAAFVAADEQQKEKVATCPGKLGMIGESIFRRRNAPLSEYLETVAKQLRAQGKGGFRTFVFSHTHRAQPAFQPLEEPGGGPYVINTGAFQRVISPEALRSLQRAKKLADKDVLPKLAPEDLPACYGVARIAPGKSKPELLSWRGGPKLAEPCP
jgi:UDP-2,3-diacylglucosamine pyrophosphatase LpxH